MVSNPRFYKKSGASSDFALIRYKYIYPSVKQKLFFKPMPARYRKQRFITKSRIYIPIKEHLTG